MQAVRRGLAWQLGSRVFWKELESRLPKTICSEWFPLMHTLEGRMWGSDPAPHFSLKTESGPFVQSMPVLSLCARQCLNLRNCQGKYKGGWVEGTISRRF